MQEQAWMIQAAPESSNRSKESEPFENVPEEEPTDRPAPVPGSINDPARFGPRTKSQPRASIENRLRQNTQNYLS